MIRIDCILLLLLELARVILALYIDYQSLEYKVIELGGHTIHRSHTHHIPQFHDFDI
jgi:hypothetical protein